MSRHAHLSDVDTQKHGQTRVVSNLAKLVLQQTQQDTHSHRLERESLRVPLDRVVVRNRRWRSSNSSSRVRLVDVGEQRLGDDLLGRKIVEQVRVGHIVVNVVVIE